MAPRQLSPSVALHWISAALVFLAFALGWLTPSLEDLGWDEAGLAAHRQVGLTVLLLLGLRLVRRASTAMSPSASSQSALLKWAGHISHITLYVLLAALPVLGWAMTNAQGHTVHFWGVLRLPDWLAADPDWVDQLQEWHESAGQALLVLVGLHFSAALFHHLILKDQVLNKMLPWLKRAPRP